MKSINKENANKYEVLEMLLSKSLIRRRQCEEHRNQLSRLLYVRRNARRVMLKMHKVH
jgi:hypothetical protein